jgi:TRAP-type C4-dicarboxylate transport system substrate-binding protein
VYDRRVRCLLALFLLLPVAARADAPQVLRMATIAPDGTAWARELKALGREIETLTDGRVRVRWYWGAIAGDELQVEDRIRRGQLDGAISGGVMCDDAAPSLRVLRLPGLVQSNAESSYLAGRLRSVFDKESLEHGLVNIGESALGPSIVLTRMPVRSMADLRKQRLWIWEHDEMSRDALTSMGLRVVPLPIHEAGKAYDEKRIDGFITPASAALAFQWSTQARYYTELRVHFSTGCLMLSTRVFDAMPVEAQRALRQAAAKVQVRISDTSRTMDEQLLGGLFEKQGLTRVPVSDSFRADFFDSAQSVREKVAARLISRQMLDKVLSLIADYRAEHH